MRPSGEGEVHVTMLELLMHLGCVKIFSSLMQWDVLKLFALSLHPTQKSLQDLSQHFLRGWVSMEESAAKGRRA